MGLAGGNVLPVKVPVEIDRDVDVLHDRIGSGAETSAPHFVAHIESQVAEFAEVAFMTELSTEPAFKLRRRQMTARAVMALCGAVAVLAGIYGIGRLRSNPADAACQPAVNIASRIAPLAQGEVAAFSVAQKPFRVPNVAFKDAQGHDKTSGRLAGPHRPS